MGQPECARGQHGQQQQLRAGDGGTTRVEASGEKLWPETLDIMGWSVDPEGFGVIFQRTIPNFVTEHLGQAVSEMLARMALPADSIDRFVCHPGGAKVIMALERALALGQGTLDHEREVIADYGNMSAPTVLRLAADRVRCFRCTPGIRH